VLNTASSMQNKQVRNKVCILLKLQINFKVFVEWSWWWWRDTDNHNDDDIQIDYPEVKVISEIKIIK